MRLFDWFVRHLYWAFPAAALGVWLGVGLLAPLPVEDLVLKQRVVAALAPAADQAVGDTLRVDLARVAPFAWDTLYVFSRVGTVEDISQATGLAWRGQAVHSDNNLLVFLRRGQLAGFVEFRGYTPQPGARFVNFDGHFQTGELFTPATACFRAVPKAASQANGVTRHYLELHTAPGTAPVHRPGYARHLAQIQLSNKDATP